jgi:hypothetical protein
LRALGAAPYPREASSYRTARQTTGPASPSTEIQLWKSDPTVIANLGQIFNGPDGFSVSFCEIKYQRCNAETGEQYMMPSRRGREYRGRTSL